MTVKTERVKISELKPGDIVHDHGMRLLCGEFHVSQSHARPLTAEQGETRWCKARVLNPDEVRAANHVPVSWWIDGWTVQSNDLDRWTRELPA